MRVSKTEGPAPPALLPYHPSVRGVRLNLLFAAAVIGAGLVYVPWGPVTVEQEPDLSLRLTAHEAFARHFQFGSDIIYTYGPWGILGGGVDARTCGASLIGSLFIALGAGIALARLGMLLTPGLASATLFVASGLSILKFGSADVRYLAVFCLILALETADQSFFKPGLITFAAGALVSLIKVSYLPMAGVLVTVVLLRARTRGGPQWVKAATFLLGGLAAWAAARQSLANIPAFLLRSNQIIAGYTGAASRGTVGVSMVFTLVAASVILLVLLGYVTGDAETVLGLAALQYVALRTTFTRIDDTHTATGYALLLFITLLFVAVAASSERMLRIKPLKGLVIAAQAGVLVLTFSAWEQLPQRIAAFLRAPAAAERAYRLEASQRVKAAGLPPIQGTVDAYPWSSGPLILRGFDYHPRPVFQSYMAWSSDLETLNLQHLSGSAAPDRLLIDIGTIDERFPLQDDAPSWLEILRRYTPEWSGGDRAVLRRMSLTRAVERRFVTRLVIPFGRWVALPSTPSDSLLWCVPTRKVRTLEGLYSLFERPPRLLMTLKLADGKGEHFVLLTRPSGGFLLSPAITTTSQFVRLNAAPDRVSLPERRVLEVRLDREGDGSKDPERMELRIDAITIRTSGATKP